VRWALADGPGPLLDPSFGGCGFLNVALNVMQEMGSTAPGSLIFGIDVDRKALKHTTVLQERGVPPRHLLVSDFFRESASGGAIPPCRAVVGNPPYIRHHRFQARQRLLAQRALETISARLPESANAWAYFVVYASAFVAPAGRLAMLLPTAASRARYSEAVLRELGALFGSISLVTVKDRLFEGVREGTVVLLADDRGNHCAGVSHYSVDGISDLRALLGGALTGRHTQHDLQGLSPGPPTTLDG